MPCAIPTLWLKLGTQRKNTAKKKVERTVQTMDNWKLKVTLKYYRNNSTDLFSKTCSLITHFCKVFNAIFSSEQLCRISASNYLQAGCWLCCNAWQQNHLPHTNSCSLCAAMTSPSATTTHASTKGMILQRWIKSQRKEMPLAAKRSCSQCSSLLLPYHERSVLRLLSRGCYGKRW